MMKRLRLGDEDVFELAVLLKTWRSKRARVVLPEEEGPDRPMRRVCGMARYGTQALLCLDTMCFEPVLWYILRGFAMARA